jgi:hypothetical protein
MFEDFEPLWFNMTMPVNALAITFLASTRRRTLGLILSDPEVPWPMDSYLIPI